MWFKRKFFIFPSAIACRNNAFSAKSALSMFLHKARDLKRWLIVQLICSMVELEWYGQCPIFRVFISLSNYVSLYSLHRQFYRAYSNEFFWVSLKILKEIMIKTLEATKISYTSLFIVLQKAEGKKSESYNSFRWSDHWDKQI